MGANPQKGEVPFAVTDPDGTYTLQFTIDAVCVLEDLLDKPIARIGALLASGRLSVIRAALFAGLQAHHPEITLKEAGELIPRLKDRTALEVVSEAVGLAFGHDGEAAGEGAGGPRKRKAAGGGGTS